MTDTVAPNAHTIKLFFQGEIRRFGFTGNSFQQLCAEISSLLAVPAEFSVRYEDDEGDWVTIKSDPELDYAFSITGSRVLKLRIVQKPSVENPAEGTVSRTISSEKPWKELKKEVKLAKKEWKNEAKLAKKEWKTEVKLAKKDWKTEGKQAKSLYVARFVKHVTVEDGSEICPGTPFVKTWRFRNEGTLPWPEQSVLLCVGKKADRMGVTSDSIVLERSVLPGEEIDVSVNMISPSGAGSYTGYWRLADPSGRKFGPRVRVQIKVVDSSSSSSDEGASSWGEMLSQLESMGFTNKGLNVKLLVKTHGNMDKVIRKLLKREEKMSGIVGKKIAAM
jgi:biotin carboxyl carrier protein